MRSRFIRFLPLLPPALLLLTIATAGRDVLVWDEWVVWGELLARMKEGGFGFGDLIAQQNEQRNLTPRLVGLALMPLFHLNRFPEYIFNFCIAGCTFFALRRLCRITLPNAPGTPNTNDGTRKLFVTGALALFCFSLAQWETFLVGLNISQSCTTLGITLGALLARAPLTVPRLAALLVAGFFASFSIVNGLFYWPVLLPAVFFATRGKGTPPSFGAIGRRAAVVIWLCAGLACWFGYFYGYVAPGHHPGVLNSLTHPLRLLGCFFITLGGACVSDPALWPIPLGIGAAASLLLLRDLIFILRNDRTALRALAPWLCLLVFALLSAAAISAGRAFYRDMGYTLQSRYVTLCLPFWAALLAFSIHSAAHPAQSALMRRLRAGFWIAALGTAIVTNIGLFFHLQGRGRQLDAMRNELFHLENEPLLEKLFPDPAYLAARLPLFLERRLSPYEDIKSDASYAPGVIPVGFESSLRVTAVEKGLGGLPGFKLEGRAFTGGEQKAAQRIFVLEGGRIIHVGAVDAQGNFSLFLPLTHLTAGEHMLTAAALLPDGGLVSLGNLNLDSPAYMPEFPRLRRHFYFPGEELRRD